VQHRLGRLTQKLGKSPRLTAMDDRAGKV
jgi:hypothetical protein